MILEPAVGRGVFCSGAPRLLFYGLSRWQAKTRPVGLKQFACRTRDFTKNNDGSGRSRGKTPPPTAGSRLMDRSPAEAGMGLFPINLVRWCSNGNIRQAV